MTTGVRILSNNGNLHAPMWWTAAPTNEPCVDLDRAPLGLGRAEVKQGAVEQLAQVLDYIHPDINAS